MRYYRPDAFPPIVKNLIIINVLVFVAQLMFDKQYGITGLLAMWPIGHELFSPYQIATHMFTHGGFMHIIFNMFALWMFGRVLENVWGPKRFLLFYLLSGIGAAAAHLGMQLFFGDGAPAVGASGAIMGIFAAFAYLFPNTELFIMFIPFPVKAKWAVLGLAAIDLFGGFARFSGDNIAHFAHLGGAITGFIIVLIWNKTDKRRFY
ncbi:MAG TPA: rhomboid family intramembrane serine protease [Chitinophagaceae bacterium]